MVVASFRGGAVTSLVVTNQGSEIQKHLQKYSPLQIQELALILLLLLDEDLLLFLFPTGICPAQNQVPNYSNNFSITPVGFTVNSVIIRFPAIDNRVGDPKDILDLLYHRKFIIRFSYQLCSICYQTRQTFLWDVF